MSTASQPALYGCNKPADPSTGPIRPFSTTCGGRSQKFDRISLIERDTRCHGDTAIIVGRTQMAGSFAGASFTAASRYTHVLLRGQDDHWHLVSAQGTRIADQQ